MLINFMILQEKGQQKKGNAKPKNGPYGKGAPGAMAVQNNHNISGYFNKPLDESIQGLNRLTPLFVEKCVEYIEKVGELYIASCSVTHSCSGMGFRIFKAN